MIYIFIDTEFTDFTNMDLISLGAVTEDGSSEFYVEISNHIADFRTDFVNEVVMPLLDLPTYGKTHDWAARNLADWLNSLNTDVMMIVDYGGDWILMNKLLQKCPPVVNVQCQFLTAGLMHMLRERGVHSPASIDVAYKTVLTATEQYFDIDPRRHHALVDAKANRYGWVTAYEAAK